MAAAIAAVAVGYHFSLSTLAANWRYETPLADLALVPPLAAALLIAVSRRHRYVTALKLGRLDLLLATLLVAASLIVVTAGPAYSSKYFWAMRLDLLTLPLFAAAAIILLFGSRALVPFLFPLLFLFLAWPLPYLAILEHILDTFTHATAVAVGHLAGLSGIATPVAGSDYSRYLIQHGGSEIVVSVASACSGVNSLVGFGIVGVAALWLVRGIVLLRIAWLATGAIVVWSLNVARIMAVLFVAHHVGKHAAFDLLHPVAGILALNVAFLLLFWLLPRFRLTRRHFDDEDEIVDTPLARAAPPPEQATPWRIAPRLLLLVAAAATLALADSQLQTASSGLEATGRPALAAFVDEPVAGSGWTVRRLEEISWAAPYYGRHSSWNRYRLRPRGALIRRGRFTVWADAILSPDLGALDAYSLAHCYSFHRFHVETSRRLDLGDGVIGRLFVYRTSRALWHTLAWEWPVHRGKKIEHERIVLLASTGTRPKSRLPQGSGPLTAKVLAVLDLHAQNRDPNPALSRALARVGSGMIEARIAGEGRT